MALDPEIKTVLDDLAATSAPAPDTLTVAENRAAGLAFASFAGDVVPVREVRDTTFRNGDHDVPIRIYVFDDSREPVLWHQAVVDGDELAA